MGSIEAEKTYKIRSGMLCLDVESKHILREKGFFMKNLEVISAKMLKQYFHRRDALIIDMRSQEEYYQEHLPGAIHIPYEDEEVFYSLPREKIIILCCERGSSSLARAKEMASQGYRVKSVSSGVMACRECGMIQ